MKKSKTIKIKTSCNTIYTTVVEENKKIFFSSGKNGGCVATLLEALARMTTLVLEKGGTLEEVKVQLAGILCPSPSIVGNPKKDILSCSDGISKAIEIYLEDEE